MFAIRHRWCMQVFLRVTSVRTSPNNYCSNCPLFICHRWIRPHWSVGYYQCQALQPCPFILLFNIHPSPNLTHSLSRAGRLEAGPSGHWKWVSFSAWMDTTALFGMITTTRLLGYPLNHAEDLSFAHSAIVTTQLAMSLRTIKNGAPSMVMDSFTIDSRFWPTQPDPDQRPCRFFPARTCRNMECIILRRNFLFWLDKLPVYSFLLLLLYWY